jgi:hypothetical protein
MQSTSGPPRCRQPPETADGLHPAKDLLHELPFPLTHRVARITRRARIRALGQKKG